MRGGGPLVRASFFLRDLRVVSTPTPRDPGHPVPVVTSVSRSGVILEEGNGRTPLAIQDVPERRGGRTAPERTCAGGCGSGTGYTEGSFHSNPSRPDHPHRSTPTTSNTLAGPRTEPAGTWTRTRRRSGGQSVSVPVTTTGHDRTNEGCTQDSYLSYRIRSKVGVSRPGSRPTGCHWKVQVSKEDEGPLSQSTVGRRVPTPDTPC